MIFSFPATVAVAMGGRNWIVTLPLAWASGSTDSRTQSSIHSSPNMTLIGGSAWAWIIPIKDRFGLGLQSNIAS